MHLPHARQHHACAGGTSDSIIIRQHAEEKSRGIVSVMRWHLQQARAVPAPCRLSATLAMETATELPREVDDAVNVNDWLL